MNWARMVTSVKRPTAIATLLLSSLVAADEPLPEMDFIEYLGSWEESDDEWIIFDDSRDTTEEERSDPARKGEESPEKDDED